MIDGNLALSLESDDALVPDMSYQSGGAKAFPEWVPCMLPIHAESLCEQVTEAYRGPGKGTTDFSDLFLDEERELKAAFVQAHLWAHEVPF